MTQQLTVNGLKYIKGNEGCVLHPYDDGFGNTTIGWGMTHYPNGTPVKLTDSAITQAQADAYFIQEVQPYLQTVIDHVKVPLNTNQYASLTDFCYNEGDGRFEESILLEHINTNCVVESDFTKYCYANGEYVQDLFNRRQSEYDLFMTPIISNKNKIMTDENTSTSAETVSEVKAEAQTLKITSVTVTYNKTVNGEVTMTAQPATVNVTPELIAALSLADSGLIEEGFNITVIA